MATIQEMQAKVTSTVWNAFAEYANQVPDDLGEVMGPEIEKMIRESFATEERMPTFDQLSDDEKRLVDLGWDKINSLVIALYLAIQRSRAEAKAEMN